MMKNKGETQTGLKNDLKLAIRTWPRAQTQQRENKDKIARHNEAIG
jgi:hypothetical protein